MAKVRKIKEKIRTGEKKIIKYEFTHLDKIILTVIGACGFIVFWKGITILIERYLLWIDPVIFVVFGLVLMLIAGWFIKR